MKQKSYEYVLFGTPLKKMYMFEHYDNSKDAWVFIPPAHTENADYIFQCELDKRGIDYKIYRHDRKRTKYNESWFNE